MLDNPKINELKRFGILISLLIPLVIGYLLPLINGKDIKQWTFIFGIILLIISFIKPTLLKYIYKLWMLLGDKLAIINSYLLLGVVFFLVLQPIAFLMKLIGYDPLKLKKMRGDSYREITKDKKIDLKRIF